MKPPSPQEPLFPDQKPIRVTVPVSPEVLAEFQALAAASGMSVGKCMGEWLSDTVEGVRSMRDLLEKAREAPKMAVAQLNAYALGLSDLTTNLLEDVKKLAPGDVARAAGRAAGDAPAPRATARPTAKGTPRTPLPPPSGNTGGKVPKAGRKGGSRK